MEDRLQELECPFTWNVPEPESREYILKQLKDNEDQSHFIINGFCVFIVECFERARGDEIQLALRKAEECEIELREYSPIGLSSRCNKNVWEKSHDALWHVLLGTLTHLAYKNNDLEYVEEKIEKIIPVNHLDEDNLAALWGIKSRFYQTYGASPPFCLSAIECARNSVQLDESIPLWHFLLGKSIARNRRNRFPYDPPSDEEVYHLERAWNECKMPEIGVMLLHTYQSCIKKSKGKQFYQLKERILETINDIKAEAADEWYIYWRCAHICVRLTNVVPPQEVKNLIDLAFEFSDKSHNTNLKHLWEVSAAYYKFIGNDYKKALEFSVKAADEGEMTCAFDVISITHRFYGGKDVLPIINKYIEHHSFQDKKNHLILAKANYLMFVKGEIKEAFKIYLEIMSKEGSSYLLSNCRPLFNEAPKCYSLYKRLRLELQEAIKRSNIVNDIEIYRSYLNILSDNEERIVNNKK